MGRRIRTKGAGAWAGGGAMGSGSVTGGSNASTASCTTLSSRSVHSSLGPAASDTRRCTGSAARVSSICPEVGAYRSTVWSEYTYTEAVCKSIVWI